MARSLADKSNNDTFRLRLATVIKKCDKYVIEPHCFEVIAERCSWQCPDGIQAVEARHRLYTTNLQNTQPGVEQQRSQNTGRKAWPAWMACVAYT